LKQLIILFVAVIFWGIPHASPSAPTAFVEYNTSAANAFGGMIDGFDGNIWASETAAILKIEPDGNSTRFPFQPDPLGPVEIVTTPLTTGPDGALWFGEGYNRRIGKITQSGQIIEFPPFPPGPNPTNYQSFYEFASGPDGNMWVVESPEYRLWRVTPDGAFTQIVSVNLTYGFGDIIVGPDHNLWMGAFSSLERITPDGTVTRFPTPDHYFYNSPPDTHFGDSPYKIVIGQNQDLWFPLSGNKIGRCTMEGAITEFPLGGWVDPALIESFQMGPDGNLWFLINRHWVGRMTKEGAFTTFQVPGPYPGVYFLASGSDGALWMTDDNQNEIRRLTTDGQFTEFPLNNCSLNALGLITGSDGNLWFPVTKGNYPSQKYGIARLNPRVPYFIPGDVNNDGDVNVGDLVAMIQVALSLRTASEFEIGAGDVRPKPGTNGKAYGDGKIRMDDVNWTLRRSLGLTGQP
jgi:virginiamycin B lyase